MIDEDATFGDRGYTLAEVKADFFDVLSRAIPEIKGLRYHIVQGLIDGDLYSGPCACLKGTIAKVRGCNYKELGIECSPYLPAEELFLLIKPGHTPENNEYSALAVQWIDEFVAGLK